MHACHQQHDCHDRHADMRVISSMTVFTEVCLLCPAMPLHKCLVETLLPVSSRLLREYVSKPLHCYVLIGKL